MQNSPLPVYKIYEACQRIGCCELCCLRYSMQNDRIKQLLISRMQPHLEAVLDQNSNLQLNNHDDSSTLCHHSFKKNDQDEILEKNNKNTNENELPATTSQICVVCFGIFDDIIELQTSPCYRDFEKFNTDPYIFQDYTLHIYQPYSLSIRDRAVIAWLLQELAVSLPNISEFKVWFRQILEEYIPRISHFRHAKMIPNSTFSLVFKIVHDETFIAKIKKAIASLSVPEILKTTKIPPDPVKTRASASFSWVAEPIFIGGRYTKNLRHVSNSPMTPEMASVEEQIINPFKKRFRCDEAKFRSSGREDYDVRMLGDGRPFAFELHNPRAQVIDQKLLDEVQEDINKNTHGVRSLYLTQLNKEHIKILTEGESTKKKTYRCLVWIKDAINPSTLSQKISTIKDLEINQQTPIRVLKSRGPGLRKKTIHSAKWHPLKNSQTKQEESHFFILDLTTSAGTYVKEFVHGDRGRTLPNMGSLLDSELDILQLDVLSVDLKFP